jgi:hypothetical protein
MRRRNGGLRFGLFGRANFRRCGRFSWRAETHALSRNADEPNRTVRVGVIQEHLFWPSSFGASLVIGRRQILLADPRRIKRPEKKIVDRC